MDVSFSFPVVSSWCVVCDAWLQAESTAGSDRDEEGEGEGDLFHLGADATLREWMLKAGVDVDEVGGVG